MKRRFYTTQDYLACLESSYHSDWAVYDRTLAENEMPIAVFANRTHARDWARQMNDVDRRALGARRK